MKEKNFIGAEHRNMFYHNNPGVFQQILNNQRLDSGISGLAILEFKPVGFFGFSCWFFVLFQVGCVQTTSLQIPFKENLHYSP